MKRLILTALFACSMASASQAAVTVDFTQSGSDVVAITSGSLDLTGITFTPVPRDAPAGIASSDAIFIATNFLGNYVDVSGAYLYFRGLSGPASFGTQDSTFASSSSGDFFGVGGSGGLLLAPTYASGDPINAVTTFANSTFASLGLTPGTYVFTVPNDTITINIPSAVPEPSTWVLMLMGFGAVGFAIRRKRTQFRITYA